MAQLTPNNRHHSESTWSICYGSACSDRVFDRCQNAISFPGCIELGHPQLLMKLWYIICKKKKTLLVPENELMSIKTAFDPERVESQCASKQRPYVSPTVIWLAFVGKYLKYWSYPVLPLATTNPGLPYAIKWFNCASTTNAIKIYVRSGMRKCLLIPGVFSRS